EPIIARGQQVNRFSLRMFSAAKIPLARRLAWGYFAMCTALIAALVVFSPAALGQENATVTGTITDSSGAVVPNATVVLTNTATGVSRQVTSNSVGAYRFPNVGIGTYDLVVTASGFSKSTRTGIVVNVASTITADAKLNVGSQAQTVTVAAQALQVQTETSEVSTLISGEQVRQLSTNGRNIVQLAALGMGVSSSLPAFGGVAALTSANGLSFNGTRTTHNIYLLDGGELNDRGCGGCYMVLPSQDAIAEFQTLDSNYSPDYGIGSGGTITMVIKSGTRQYHGEVYEFNRNTANDFPTAGQDLHYTPYAGSSTPPIPLVPNLPNNAAYTNMETNLGLTPGSPFPYDATTGTYTIPHQMMDQNAVLQVNAGTFPKPNSPNGYQYIASVKQPTNVREDTVRIDHAINSKFQLMGHFVHDAVQPTFFP